jgi:oligogalacturonide lyase
MRAEITRRAFVAALPFVSRSAEIYPSQSKRLRDPATEFEITRLTEPTFNSWLIAPPGRSIVARNNALLYCSDRDGAVQAYRLDLKSGESRRLTSATKLDRTTVAYLPDERTVCFFEEKSLIATSGGRQRTVYSVEEGWERAPAFVMTDDGNHALLVERRGEKRRLRMITIGRGADTTIFEADEDITFIRPRPKRASILYGRGNSLWLVDYTGENNRRLKTAAGNPAQALWSADGKSFTYLRIPEVQTELNDLREHVPDTNEDKKIASTSQFVTFSRNVDASVFAGVSRNKGSPFILILLRIAHRELTVAEHRASNPQDVTVLFTPNSQRLLWHTDREGKSAIYSLAVERFVENTEPSEASYITGDLSGVLPL